MEDGIKMESEKLKAKTQNLPQGWRKVKLGEVLKIRRGASPRPIHEYITKTGMPWLKIADVTGSDSRFVDSTKEFIKEEGVSKSVIVKPGDLILSNSATPGIPRFMRITACVHDGWLILEPTSDSIDKYFLYYRLIIDRNKLISNVTGAIFDNLKTDVLREHEVLLPPTNEQKRIADILSAFDDKIELNNKIIKTLEEMASEIFKEWFVKFRFPGWEKTKFVDSELGKIPEGWGMEKLPEVFDFLEGPGIRNWQYTSKGCRFINIRLIKNNDIDIKSANFISEKEAYEKYKHFLLQEGDMVVSTSGTLGRTAIVRKEHLPLMLNTSVIRFRPKDGKSYGFMYQFLKSDYFQNKLLSMASGSAQPNFGPIHLKQIDLFVPEEKILENFNRLVNPIYEIIVKKLSENYSLSALRDLLLPKLMSGEIKVNSEE